MYPEFYHNLIKPFGVDIKDFFLDTLFPMQCLVCGEEGTHLCPACQLHLKTVDHQRCIACQKPAPFGLTHPACQSPLMADCLITFYNYHDDNVANLIITGKYHFVGDIYKILGVMISQKLKSDFPNLLSPKNLDICPVPLHSGRRRWRGFNQAEILCQALSAELGLPIADALIRTKPTKTQKDLRRDQRIKNVYNAFALNLNLKSEIQNHQLLLVDDVTTTGATLLQAAQVLKRNGAEKVICLTVARD